MEKGIKGTYEMTVTMTDTASALLSGNLDVLATPRMIALMEYTAAKSVAPELEEGMTTVGTKIDITHDAATPVGMNVFFETELIEVDGRRLVFKCEAKDECGHIGGGIQERFIVNGDKFMAKVNAKKNA
ncbi:MAG: thioesterase family protein [Eubacteriales bacterium]|nr:thioesterase family protein [Eubacteriales bacterium]